MKDIFSNFTCARYYFLYLLFMLTNLSLDKLYKIVDTIHFWTR
jgi:hypothetical protein